MDRPLQLILILSALALACGCTTLPGMHTIGGPPDPIVGQWIGGEPPASDLHLIFYENGTYAMTNFYLNRGPDTDRGSWSLVDGGQYELRSVSGPVTRWTRDTSDDSLYENALPQKKYWRFTG